MTSLLLGLLFACRQDADSKNNDDPNLDSENIGEGDEDGDGFTTTEGDCDDNDAAVNPGAAEICDGLDNDCNDEVDDGIGSTWYQDADNDGYGDPISATTACEQPEGFISDGSDCDDTNAAIYPGAEELCDGLDNDCDGIADSGEVLWYADSDGDGFGDPSSSIVACLQPEGFASDNTDCNDGDPAINPLSAEVCDGLDNNCDGLVDENVGTDWYLDADGDGYGEDSSTIQACTQPAGTSAFAGDCDDSDAAYNPGALELDCTDPNDYNCDGTTGYSDADGDGYAACEECDDSDNTIHPGAVEVCDGVDNDCDGTPDEADSVDAATWYADADKDGFGNPNSSTVACSAPSGYLADNTDCDDLSAAISPAATELCNGIDDNCDGIIDTDAIDISVWYTDADGDGYGEDSSTIQACTQPAGTSAFAGDCDDSDAAYNPGALELDCTDPNDYNCDGTVGYVDADGDGYAACEECDDSDNTIHPGAVEVCDGVDNDCDGTPDEADSVDAATWYADADKDGFGNPNSSTVACSAPSGYLADNTDCDDSTDIVNPAAAEVCDGLDNNCNGQIDENAADAQTWYQDSDSDGYGDATQTMLSCDRPVGYRDIAGDCDDNDANYNPGAVESDCTDPNDYNCDGVTGYVDADGDGYAACEECDDGNAAINPAAVEVCDGVDNDCDSSVDESDAIDALVWYADNDGDTYGNALVTAIACAQPPGYVADNSDCDDSYAEINPGGGEVCDGLDNDCNGLVDDGAVGAGLWYADADGDGFGDINSLIADCTQPSGYVADNTDCNDAEFLINPDAVEICDGADNNCDGVTDSDAVDQSLWYEDADGDGYGNDAVTVSSCDAPSGYAGAGGDCDDTDSDYNPGAVELCTDRFDYNCDGSVAYADADNDGYAACEECDDGNAAVNPGEVESCNGIDDNCDGSIDEAGALGESTFYLDSDGDGYGSSTSITSCSTPSGYVANSSDCDDSNARISPAATESCNGVDDDCDGSVDEAGASGESSWYRDADADGYGSSSATSSCSQPSGYVANSSDCNDSNASINPAAADICDNIDNNCDGAVDNGGYCPCNLHYYGTKPYLFCASSASWSSAATTCESYGYILATINDSSENTWLVDTAYTYYQGKWWSGGNDEAVEGTWVWRSGQSWSYSNWHSGEPNNLGNEDCMQLGRFADYTWNDEQCSSEFYYICEGD